MNDNRFSKEDKQLSYLLSLTKFIRTYYRDTDRATQLSNVVLHKDQVKDLISEIAYTLKEFPNWSSGRSLTEQLLEIKNKLQCHYEKVYLSNRGNPERIVGVFNEQKEHCETILEDLLQLFN